MNRKSMRLACLVLPAVVLFGCGYPGPKSEDPGPGIHAEGWIGIYVQNLDREMQRYLDLPSRHGALVTDVVDNGPADVAGLRREDVIIRVDGKSIRDTDGLTRRVLASRPGNRLRLEVVRDGERERLTVRVGERPDSFADEPDSPRHPQPPYGSPSDGNVWLGIQPADLNSDLGQYFHVEENGGVLVLSVAQDSPASAAGLRSGDVILRIDGDIVPDTEALLSVLSEKEPEQRIEIEIQRRRRTRTLRARLDRKQNQSYFKVRPEDKNRWEEGLREWKKNLKKWKDNLSDKLHEDSGDQQGGSRRYY